jgi:hypothetical protein
MLLAACDAGDKKALPPAPEQAAPASPAHGSDVAPRDHVTILGGPPQCTDPRILRPGTARMPRTADASRCSLIGNPSEGGGEVWATFAIEAFSAADLARHIRCTTPPPVDWDHDRALVFADAFQDSHPRVGAVFDDGTTQSVQLALDSKHGGTSPDFAHYELVLAAVPLDRRVSPVACWAPEAAL